MTTSRPKRERGRETDGGMERGDCIHHLDRHACEDVSITQQIATRAQSLTTKRTRERNNRGREKRERKKKETDEREREREKNNEPIDDLEFTRRLRDCVRLRHPACAYSEI